MKVSGCAANMNKTFKTGLRPGKTGKPPLRAMEMHPFCSLWRRLSTGKGSRDFQVAVLPYKSRSLATPVGEILATLCIEMLMGEMVPRGLLSHRTAGWQGNWIRREPLGD